NEFWHIWREPAPDGPHDEPGNKGGCTANEQDRPGIAAGKLDQRDIYRQGHAAERGEKKTFAVLIFVRGQCKNSGKRREKCLNDMTKRSAPSFRRIRKAREMPVLFGLVALPALGAEMLLRLIAHLIAHLARAVDPIAKI